jgi:superfamily I DNA/RNA helicase
MGFASYLEDLSERYFEDRFEIDFAWDPATSQTKAVVREPASPVVGPPLAAAREAVTRFGSMISTTSPDLYEVKGAWDEHFALLRKLDQILEPAGSSAGGPALSLGELRSIENKARVLIDEARVYGPVSPEVARRLCDVSTVIHRRCVHLLSDLATLTTKLRGLHFVEKERSEVEKTIREIESILDRVRSARVFLSELEEVSNRVHLNWNRFVRLLRKAVVDSNFRPVLKNLDRLNLEEGQERIVSLDYDGERRVNGVSGSGKTIILIHRALRLARENPVGTVRVFTLNRALSTLLESTIDTLARGRRPKNLQVHCTYDFLHQCLGVFQSRARYRLVDPVSKERIAIAWQQFVHHFGSTPEQTVFARGEVKALIRYLVSSGMRDPEGAFRYLREEIMYVESAYRRRERTSYLHDSRRGRKIELSQGQRSAVLLVLSAWEDWLAAGELCDQEGLSIKASEFFVPGVFGRGPLARIRAAFPTSHVLVDEAQDLSTVELRMLRGLVADPDGRNAYFLTGDFNQKVYVRHHNTVHAGFDFTGRSDRLSRNYRNTREILEAAFCIARAHPPIADEGAEIIPPEYSTYHGGKPVVVGCRESDQVELAVNLAMARRNNRLAVVSESEATLDSFVRQARRSGMEVYELRKNEDLDKWVQHANVQSAFTIVAPMEAVKGYEFDTVLALDVSEGVVPRSDLPPQEYWRPAAVLYSALTRARDELVITHGAHASPFIQEFKETVQTFEGIRGDELEKILLSNHRTERLLKRAASA